MTNAFRYSKGIILAGLSIIVITAAAWQTDDKNKHDTATNRTQAGDTTVPKQSDNHKNEFELKDLDLAMKQLDIAMKNLSINLQGMDTLISKNVHNALAQINFEDINKQVQEELKNIDFEKVNLDVKKAMQQAQEELKNVDFKQLNTEINKSLQEAQEEIKNIDFNKINSDVNKSLKEAQEEIKKIDMTKMQNEMKELQMKINSGEFKMQMDDVKKEMEKAKQELKDFKDFTDVLQKDGLIDKSKGFTIEWKKDGDLIINGKTQPKEIADKYSRYYRKDGYKIKINAGDDDDLEVESF